MASGGPRKPSPTSPSSYINRSDLRTAQPIRTQTDQPYGQAGMQQEWQRAVPLQNNNPAAQAAAMGPAGGGGGVAPAPPAGSTFNPVTAQPAQVTPPPMPGLMDPSMRPQEPVTAGIDSGPGVGSDALGLGTAAPKVSDTLNAMAQMSGNPELQQLAAHAKAMNQ